MAIIGNSRIFIEPDNQYTTITTYRDEDTGGDTLITPGQNQTIAVAFNKARDDLASLVGGGKLVRQATINVRIE